MGLHSNFVGLTRSQQVTEAARATHNIPFLCAQEGGDVSARGPPLRGPAPTRAPAPGGPRRAPRGPTPAPAPVPSSSLSPALQPGIDHYSIILDCIN
jgi:hypothetical protein